MKKLLFLLTLMPILVLGQNLNFDHSYIEESPFAVGDTITVKFNTLSDSNSEVYFMIFDYQYNNKLLEKIDHSFILPNNSSASRDLSRWDGYSFNIVETGGGVPIAPSQLDSQYYWGWLYGSNVYSLSNDWSVERITIQEANSSISHNETLLEVRFKIKDRQDTGYSDYTELTRLNWVKATDSNSTSDNNLSSVGVGPSGINLNLEREGPVTGVNAGTITLNLNTPSKANYATDFTYKVYEAIGVNGRTGNALFSGNVDTNGQIIFNGGDLILNERYYLELKVKDNTQWLDDVITVTDVYLLFQQAIAAQNGGNTPGPGSANTFDYSLQYLLGELNNSGNINFDDSYQALGHIQGVEELSPWFTSFTNGSKNVSGRVEQLGVATNDYYFGQNFVFTPTDSIKFFDFGHALIGDVDFSHSYTPMLGYLGHMGMAGRKSKTSLTSNALKTSSTSNLDISNTLVNGKVHLSINLEEEDLIGTQFNIKYDNTILSLDNIIFNTGNEMVNFANHKEQNSEVVVGSLDQTKNATIKTGMAYKLIFTPNEKLTNTSGLILFNFTEGVKQDGSKVKFNIK